MTNISLDIANVYLISNHTFQFVKVHFLVPLHQDVVDNFEINQMRLSFDLEILVLLDNESDLFY